MAAAPTSWPSRSGSSSTRSPACSSSWAGRAAPAGPTLERDAALEAQAIAASVIASDGRYSDTELRAFAAALAPWFDSLRRATPQQLRSGDAIRQHRAWPITPSPMFETIVSRRRRHGTDQRLALLPGGAARRPRRAPPSTTSRRASSCSRSTRSAR